jgi:hypothetical protein
MTAWRRQEPLPLEAIIVPGKLLVSLSTQYPMGPDPGPGGLETARPYIHVLFRRSADATLTPLSPRILCI